MTFLESLALRLALLVLLPVAGMIIVGGVLIVLALCWLMIPFLDLSKKDAP